MCVSKVNGVIQTLLPHQGSDYQIFYSGRYVRFENLVGLSVEFDGYWIISVSVPPVYKNLTCGMCGNYDDNPSNDLRLANGTDVGSNSNAGNLVGDSFVVADAEQPDMR